MRTKTKKNHKKHNKSNKKVIEEKEEKVLFVFYTFADASVGGSWEYSKMPKGWWWVGSGNTSALGDKKMKYENEEQFSGTEDAQGKTKQYLNGVFTKLKTQNVITRFKIETSYLP